ncbi:MAG: TrkH family potassium uptake protein [Thalassobaculales bacterium]
MFSWRPILFIEGLLLVGLAAAMLLPALVDFLAGDPDWQVFLAAATVTLYAGGMLLLGNRGASGNLNLRQTYALTTLSWLLICAFAALPFAFGEPGLSYADAFFEAMSGLTTTGSTVIVGLDDLPAGTLLWRGLLQMLGGIGIIAMAVAILPFLSVGGMQLFRTESSDRSEKVLPRPGQVAAAIVNAYLALLAVAALSFWLAGMSGLDAVVHAMAALSTGGFSNHDASLGWFDSALIEWLSILFMVLGSLPFLLYVRMAQGHRGALLADSQVRVFCGVLVVSAAVLAGWNLAAGTFEDTHQAVRRSAFAVVTVVTTTGFTVDDFSAWGAFPLIFILFLMAVGGCTGSTTGGVKIFRLQIVALMVRYHLRQNLFPRRVFSLQYAGRPVTAEVMLAVVVFLFIYLGVVMLLAAALSLFGIDFLTALSGALTAVSNVGPGLGPIIGPAGNFRSLPDGAIWILSLGMLLGRLELLTVMVFFMRSYWKN